MSNDKDKTQSVSEYFESHTAQLLNQSNLNEIY